MKQESVWDYPRPPRIERVDWSLKVEQEGKLIAATQSGVRVLETSHPPCFYFPPEDVRFRSFWSPARHAHFCEWKGQAKYWHLRTVNGLIEDVAWSYSNPVDPVIKNHLSFYAGRVEACFVNDERVRPQEGDFYGGWIMSWVKGPFKGGPGTRGW